jgi:hypothetical protein
MEHVWIGVWLTDDLEGAVCGNCERECLDPSEVDFPCERSKPKKKSKKVIIESRYIGDLPFPSWKEWHKYQSYDTMKSALMAIETKNRTRYGNFEYRIKPK